MNRTVFSLPDRSEYRTRGGLLVTRSVEHFSGGASRLDDLIELLDRRRGASAANKRRRFFAFRA
jgi:anthranilate synthase